MFKIVIKTTGVTGLPKKVRKFHMRLIERVPAMLALIAQEITAIARNDYLSGPRSKTRLGVISGDLRRSIEKGKPGNIYRLSGNTLVMGSNLPYAAAHEYGFKGSANIPSHVREVKAIYGRYRGVVRQFVSAHSRKMNLPERPYLRPALKDSIKVARSIINDMAQKSLREAGF